MAKYKNDNDEILADLLSARQLIEGPRVGDYVVRPNGEYSRFTHDWPEKLQDGGGVYSQYFFVETGDLSYSGSLDSGFDKADLEQTGETKKGQVWFFKNNHRTAHNGIEYMVDCRVYRVRE